MNNTVYQFLDGVSFKLRFHNEEKSLLCQAVYQQTIYLRGKGEKEHSFSVLWMNIFVI